MGNLDRCRKIYEKALEKFGGDTWPTANMLNLNRIWGRLKGHEGFLKLESRLQSKCKVTTQKKFGKSIFNSKLIMDNLKKRLLSMSD